jgi:putative serine protease PepD
MAEVDEAQPRVEVAPRLEESPPVDGSPPLDGESPPPVAPGRGRLQLLSAVVLSACLGLIGGAAAAWGIYQRLGPAQRVVQVGGTGGGPGSAPAVGSLVADVAPAVVKVVTRPVSASDLLSPAQGFASGFVVSGDGLVVTSAHAVQGASQLRIALNDGRVADAVIAGKDVVHGIVALRAVGVSGLPTLSFASSPPRPGDTAIAVGAPPFGSPSVSAGIVSAVNRTLSLTLAGAPVPVLDALSTDAVADPADDGAPLLDGVGHVTGVVVVDPANPASGLQALSGRAASALVDDIGRGSSSEGALGLATAYLDPATAALAGLPAGDLIEAVTAGGPAAAAGLVPGDVVTAVDGTAIDASHHLDPALAGTAVGQAVSLTVVHAAKSATVSLTAVAAG